MTALRVVKMEGAGNDYVYVDGIRDAVGAARFTPALVAALADRHFGVGGDGVILLAPGDGDGALRMVMWNADGSRGAFCGNGLRCLALLACAHGHVRAGDPLRIATDSGAVDVELLPDADGRLRRARHGVPPLQVAHEPATVVAAGRTWSYHSAAAGNPQAVVFLEAGADLDAVPLAALGAALQRDPRFPDGVNVSVAQPLAADRLRQRTFERGSGETLACGSAATVTACAAVWTGRCRGPEIGVELRGGTLTVVCDAARPTLEGPGRIVFTGDVPDLQDLLDAAAARRLRPC